MGIGDHGSWIVDHGRGEKTWIRAKWGCWGFSLGSFVTARLGVEPVRGRDHWVVDVSEQVGVGCVLVSGRSRGWAAPGICCWCGVIGLVVCVERMQS